MHCCIALLLCGILDLDPCGSAIVPLRSAFGNADPDPENDMFIQIKECALALFR